MFMLVGCTTKTSNETYPAAIVWDSIKYGVSQTEVSKDELGKQLGEIKRIKEPMTIENGDSNCISIGSKIFEIKGIDTKEVLAIEENGKIYKATKNAIPQ